jgi:O-antigen/teichoic acid export membrane protein
MDIENLLKSARSGWSWGIYEQFIQRALSLCVGFILARLVDPEAFGLVALVSIFFAIAGGIIDGGIGLSLLQKKTADDTDYTALFFSTLSLTIFFAGAFFCSASFLADFFHQPRLTALVQGFAVVLFFSNCGRVQENRLRRELRFRESSLIAIAGVSLGAIAGISMAFRGAGAWSIVGQQGVQAFVRAAALWIIYPWRPKHFPCLNKVKEMYSFGLPSFISSFVLGLVESLPGFVAGKQGAFQELGLYDRGSTIPRTCGGAIGQIFVRTNFPILSKSHHDPTHGPSLVLTFLRQQSLLISALLSLVFCNAEIVVKLLLGDHWSGSVWYLKAGCFSVFLFSLINFSTIYLLSKSCHRFVFGINLFTALAQCVFVLLFVSGGLHFMVVGDIFGKSFGVAASFFGVLRATSLSLKSQFVASLLPLLYLAPLFLYRLFFTWNWFFMALSFFYVVTFAFVFYRRP